MKSRKIQTIHHEHAPTLVEVHFVPEFSEYVCRLFDDGIHQAAADYFTNNAHDAEETARAMLRRFNATV